VWLPSSTVLRLRHLRIVNLPTPKRYANSVSVPWAGWIAKRVAGVVVRPLHNYPDART
jgi:hypothetical protein